MRTPTSPDYSGGPSMHTPMDYAIDFALHLGGLSLLILVVGALEARRPPRP